MKKQTQTTKTNKLKSVSNINRENVLRSNSSVFNIVPLWSQYISTETKYLMMGRESLKFSTHCIPRQLSTKNCNPSEYFYTFGRVKHLSERTLGQLLKSCSLFSTYMYDITFYNIMSGFDLAMYMPFIRNQMFSPTVNQNNHVLK